MKPAEARRLAAAHDVETLVAAREALSEENTPTIEVIGEDAGEKLTHVLLAIRIRTQTEDGVPLKDAYRAIMSEVRGVLTNE